MKYSNQIGAVAAVAVIVSCFMTWISIPDLGIVVTGFRTEKTGFGMPGLINTFMSSISFVLFLLPKVWAKRSNLFFTGFNLAWAFRNMILVSTCHGGDCPVKQAGLYLLMAGSAIQMIMAVFPQVKLEEKKS